MYKKMKFHPLEREYEGWLMREIEDYFSVLGIDAMCHAVGYEAKFPADEFISTYEKIFALQFKRPLSDSRSGAIYWKIDTKSGQYARVEKTSGIYYALPCFYNRDFSKCSLQHCLFWRPKFSDGELLFCTHNKKGGVDRIQKYPISVDAAEAKAAIQERAELDISLDDSHKFPDKQKKPSGDEKAPSISRAWGIRWGRFAEGLFDCDLGIRTRDASAIEVIKTVVEGYRYISEGNDVATVLVGIKGRADKVLFSQEKLATRKKSKSL